MKQRSPKSLANLKKYKPGQSGNPKGRPPLTPEQREFRTLTLDKYRSVIEIALTGTYDELLAFANDRKNSAVEVGVARLLIRAIKDGDTVTFETFAARIVGKIPEVIHVDSKNENKTTIDIQMIREARAKLLSDS